MKKRIIGILAVLFALVTLCSLTIFICNNILAKKQAERLLACDLPRNARLLDSASFAGKLSGNGNGMQWTGSILIESDTGLNKDSLYQWFAHQIQPDEPMETIDVFFLDAPYFYGHQKNRFSGETHGGPYYEIRLCTSSISGLEASVWEKVLNFDFRAH